MPSDVRIHSIIANGGSAVNVVPDYTEILYCVRAPRMETVYEMIERVKKVAEGAALATETTVEYEVLMSYAETLANKVLSECLLKNFKKVGAPVYSDKDYEFAKRINTETTNALRESNLHMYGITDPKFGSKDLHDEISDNMQLGTHLTFSTDSGDVCWQAPSCQLRVVGQPIGTSNHSWQVTVCAGSEIGHKSMICAAETMALTAADILTDEDLLSAAQAEFRAITEKKPYKCLLSKNLLPKDVSLNKK